ncbi:ABC transporter permease [Prauserella cavernicola]|uniref:ABC transporter permease subunit n=1 Tax=Prauserella cavernicola TaxID=2800127 RepID=A0A934QYY5_9PSEU|nr:ABC transporter permease subunit [Prauserella cavernicola]MBK1789138.1 ABC transporter permease subunit [Prauserella cavernicola]
MTQATISRRGGGHTRPRRSGARKGFWAALPTPARLGILTVVAIAAWQLYVSLSGVDALLFVGPVDVAEHLVAGLADGTLTQATLTTLRILGLSFVIGAFVAVALTMWAMWTQFGSDVLTLLGATLSPIPGLAILPLAMLWFGISTTSLVVVLLNAIVWPIAYNLRTGIETISPTIRAVSRNIGLRGVREAVAVLLPGSLPYILAGLRSAWAFGWRTIVGAELIFGASGQGGGIGYYLNQQRFFLEVANLFAGLVLIAVVGVLLEWLFAVVERVTVRRWGMQASA